MAIQDYEARLREIAKIKKSLDLEEKSIKDNIKKEHTLAHSQTYGGVQVQVIEPYYTLEFDLEGLKAENRETYDLYLKPVLKPSQTKIVLVKVKEEEK